MDVEFEIEGVGELIDQFDGLMDALEDELEDSMQDVVNQIEADARDNAPVGETGNLRASIESEVEKLAQAAVEGAIFTNVEYAIFQEFGTVKMAAQPFLRPALDANRDYIVSRFETAVENAEAAVT